MLNIKMYGTLTPSYQLVKSKLLESLHLGGIKYAFEDVNSVSDFIDEGIVSVPAIKINDKVVFEIKANENFNQNLRDSIQSILNMEFYGNFIKIFVPTDFSDASFNAYTFANNLAKEINGILLLTHIYWPAISEVDQFAAVDQNLEEIQKDRLNQLVKSVNQDWIGNFVAEPFIEGNFKVGFPKSELIDLSKTENAIIVMGTTGEGDTFKKLFGSLTLDIIDNCYCPLFLVHPETSFGDIKEITYFSENLHNDILHLQYTLDLCTKLKASLRLVHFRTPSEKTDYKLDDAIDLLDERIHHVNYIIEVIDVSEIKTAIAKELDQSKPNLLVMSTKHRNIIQNLFHESITKYAATHSKTPLLILSDRTE